MINGMCDKFTTLVASGSAWNYSQGHTPRKKRRYDAIEVHGSGGPGVTVNIQYYKACKRLFNVWTKAQDVVAHPEVEMLRRTFTPSFCYVWIFAREYVRDFSMEFIMLLKQYILVGRSNLRTSLVSFSTFKGGSAARTVHLILSVTYPEATIERTRLMFVF